MYLAVTCTDHGAPMPVMVFLKFRSVSYTWIRKLPRSATYTRPCCASTAMPCTVLNWFGAGSARADGLDPAAVLAELHDARVVVAIGDEDVVLGVPRQVRLPVERADTRRRDALGVLFTALEVFLEIVDRFRLAAEDHLHHRIRVELDDHVRPFVHHPDVVVLVDAHRVGKRRRVVARPPQLDELQVFVELEQLGGGSPSRAAAGARA